jgi:Tol biopolymer transport system component
VQGSQAIDVIDVATGEMTVHETGVPLGASFGPGSSDTLVYGIAHSTARNLYGVPADGSRAARAVTHNNRSAYPVWGSKGIVFDLVTPRKAGDAPIYQIAVLGGSTIMQITHTHPNYLVEGLQPIAVAANGVDLAADFVGQDTDFAYTVNLRTRKVTRLTVGNQVNTAYGISRDGTRVLVCIDGFETNPKQATRVATMPFGGGSPRVLVSGACGASWNR